jgi:hypothetical protein
MKDERSRMKDQGSRMKDEKRKMATSPEELCGRLGQARRLSHKKILSIEYIGLDCKQIQKAELTLSLILHPFLLKRQSKFTN